MFANIDGGNAAWHGLTVHDLRRVDYRLSQGQDLDSIANDLKNEITRERQVGPDFRGWVQQQRDAIPKRDQAPVAQPGLPRNPQYPTTHA
jgi:hypothetical protein